jgi:hypothetical protein
MNLVDNDVSSVTQSRLNIIVISILSIIFVFSLVGAFIYIESLNQKHNAEVTRMESSLDAVTVSNSVLEEANTVLEEEIMKLSAEIDVLHMQSCKGKWTKENGCENDLALQIISSNAGKNCFGDTMKIVWDPAATPADFVDVLLTTPGTTLRLDTIASVKGVYEWKIKQNHITTTAGRIEARIEEGDLYKIKLQSGGQPVDNGQSDFFAIAACGV